MRSDASRVARRTFLGHAAAVSTALLTGVRTGRSEQPGGFGELSAFLESQIAGGVIPGAGVVVAHRGKTVFERSWGTYCSHGKMDEPLDKSVVHPCYSFSKLISATVIVMLHQEGLLDYDAPVSGYVPKFAGGGKEKVTLRHLLAHSAGIPTMPFVPAGTEAQWDAAVDAVCALPTAWEPGSKCEYHALSALLIAGEAARRVTGKPWHVLSRERLFEPLGASTLTFELPPQKATQLSIIPRLMPAQVGQLPYGASYAGWSLGHPAGGCFGTLGDMVKVIQLHLDKGNWNGKRLIRPEAFREMHTVQYEKEIDEAMRVGKVPLHMTWGLGPLLRGKSLPQVVYEVPGFGELTSPGVFGHPGLDTLLTLGDPSKELAIVFTSTDSPKPATKVGDVRCGVTNRVVRAIG